MRKVELCLVLHAHLPYIRHPEVEEHGFEWWFYEACWEVYAPLLAMFGRLEQDTIPFRMTVSISAPLLAMFNDRFLNERLEKHLKRLAVLTKKERERTKGTRFEPAATHFYYHIQQALDVYSRFEGNYAKGFRHWQDAGRIEITTSPATHGFLPHLQDVPRSAAAQIRIGAESHRRFFGQTPPGMWLSECAYMPAHDGLPGIDEILAEEGIRYFFLDSHGINGSTPRPPHGVHAPVRTPAGVYAFGRDPDTSKQVWSATEGYPGDAWYAEHHKDLGYFLSDDQIRPLHPERTGRIPIGLKYFRVTSKSSSYKQPYIPHMALRRTAFHASHFVRKRELQSLGLLSAMRGETPVIIAPYDAELFGHWWHEGPKFLEYVFRKAHERRLPFRFAAPSDRLKERVHHVATPAASSWGDGGYYKVWLNGTNDDFVGELTQAAMAMVRATRQYGKTETERRVLAQMGRELVLAQSSDWPFIATTSEGIRPYARDKVAEFLKRFWGLHQALEKGNVSLRALERIEDIDNIFPWLTAKHWRDRVNTRSEAPEVNARVLPDELMLKPISPQLGYAWWDLQTLKDPDIQLRVRCTTPPEFTKDIPRNADRGSWYLHQIRPGSTYRLEAFNGDTVMGVSLPMLLPGRSQAPGRWKKFRR